MPHTETHTFWMEYPQILRQIMRADDLRQAALAKRLRVTQPTVSRWLKGATPEVDQHLRIIAEARRLGVLKDAAAEPPPQPAGRMVKVKGYVGAGAKAHFYAVAQGDLDEVPAPEGSTENTVAVEIRGESLGPLFDGFLVFYDEVRRPVTADLVGRLCVVGLPDDSVLIKRIKNGRTRGLFNLISARGEPIEDVAIEWAAPVIDLRPR